MNFVEFECNFCFTIRSNADQVEPACEGCMSFASLGFSVGKACPKMENMLSISDSSARSISIPRRCQGGGMIDARTNKLRV